MMTILQPWKPDQSPGGPTPPATLATSARSSITILARAKLSYCEPQPLLWVARDGWNFNYAIDVKPTQDEARRAKREQVLTFLAAQLKEGRRYSLTSLESVAGIMSLTRNELRTAVSELKVSGALLDAVLPRDEQQGRKQTYLCPAGRLPEAAKPAADDGGIEAQNDPQAPPIPPPPINPPPYRKRETAELKPPLSFPLSWNPPSNTAELAELAECPHGELPDWVEESF